MGHFSNQMKAVRCALILLTCLFSAKLCRAGTLVQFHFYLGATGGSLGDVDMELYDQDKPVTVRNFLKLVEAGAYNNSFFHRLVPGFVLQGGGYYIANPFATNLIGPPYSNIGGCGNFGNITNEFKVGKFYSNTNWTIAMAKSSDPNSANSQFFFNLANNASSLDDTNNSGGFTVFGHTLRGTNILNEFNGLTYGYGEFNLQNNYGTNDPVAALFTQLPADWSGFDAPPYDQLFYFTITILNASVQVQTNGARQITWSPIIGETNNLEYSTNLPATWHVLTSVYTTNASVTVTNFTDTATNKTRFYRIHVLYPNTPSS